MSFMSRVGIAHCVLPQAKPRPNECPNHAGIVQSLCENVDSTNVFMRMSSAAEGM